MHQAEVANFRAQVGEEDVCDARVGPCMGPLRRVRRFRGGAAGGQAKLLRCLMIQVSAPQG